MRPSPGCLLQLFVSYVYLTAARVTPKRANTVDYFDPASGGGRMFSDAGDPSVLTDDGFLKYAQAVGFSFECFGLHAGTPQTADLGDGHGALDELVELREQISDDIFGTCLESLVGGNHFRVWRQDGPKANSSALFLAVSKEKGLDSHHDLVENGYNIGRDELVANAIGTKSHDGVKYNTVVQDIPSLMPVGSEGVNHGIAVDGIVKLLTITINEEQAEQHCVRKAKP